LPDVREVVNEDKAAVDASRRRANRASSLAATVSMLVISPTVKSPIRVIKYQMSVTAKLWYGGTKKNVNDSAPETALRMAAIRPHRSALNMTASM
jgi:hypothetical protein